MLQSQKSVSISKSNIKRFFCFRVREQRKIRLFGGEAGQRKSDPGVRRKVSLWCPDSQAELIKGMFSFFCACSSLRVRRAQGPVRKREA